MEPVTIISTVLSIGKGIASLFSSSGTNIVKTVTDNAKFMKMFESQVGEMPDDFKQGWIKANQDYISKYGKLDMSQSDFQDKFKVLWNTYYNSYIKQKTTHKTAIGLGIAGAIAYFIL